MKFRNLLFVLIAVSVFENAHSQAIRDEANGDWSAQRVTLYNTPEAAIMVRAGDIDNLGFGWPAGFDPFTGATTPVHSYPFSPDTNDVDGTDRIMVITSYTGSPPAGKDGYTSTTSRPENLPRPITLTYDLSGTVVNSAVLQIFVDDFQAQKWHANYFVTINDVQAPYLAQQINTLDQTGPRGKLITAAIPAEQLSLISSGTLSILFDDLTTGAGEGYAIDFVKLLVNPTGFTYTGTIQGKVTDKTTGDALAGAIVAASGLIETTTDEFGDYMLENVAAGLINITVIAEGYHMHSSFIDLQSGQTVIYNIQMEQAPIPGCDTLRYPLPGTPTLYIVEPPESGYVCGNNVYGDLAKADYFVPPVTGKKVYRALFAFGDAEGVSGQNPDVEFRIWNNNSSNGYPGDVLGTAAVKLSQIVDDMGNQRLTEVVFDPPVEIPGAFYLGVMLPTTPGDLVALISTLHEEVDPGTAFEMWSDGTWHAFTESSSWNLRISQAIHPIYCDVGFGIEEEGMMPFVHLYPNPASDVLHIGMESLLPAGKADIHIFNFLGQIVQSHTGYATNDRMTIPLTGLSPGIYLLNISSDGFSVSRKVIVK
ncbi:MAG: carboxypeptidase regulatory-like domain-containing protein [Bacteroidales bacterium]|nr:carboxypeptidase regulatory-like domain-containing protein [Bacteroidales bacterium]